MQIQILTKNNETTIEGCLKSVVDLGDVLICDFSSTDKTLQICRQFKTNIVEVAGNRSTIRNQHISDWNFYLEPWETLAFGHEELKKAKKNLICNVLSDGFVLKQVRFWSKIQFKNPIFECLKDDSADMSNVVIYSAYVRPLYEETIKAIADWKKSRITASEPYYYEASVHLSYGKTTEFQKTAREFLFREPGYSLPALMTRYYLSSMYLSQKQIKAAIKELLPCLAVKPLMAEYWCLLGDIYYFGLNKYSLAYEFYENAIELGKERLKNDIFPVEISKYQEYPLEMMTKCQDISSSKEFFGMLKY